jgi:hypothetical protein
MEKIDRIIRAIREEMTVGNGGFTGAGDPLTKAGFDPILPGVRRRRDGEIDKRIRKMYKKWLNH